MRIRTVIVSSALAAALFAGLPSTVQSETLDSGIFGVVPDQSLVVQTQQQRVDIMVKELATVSDQDHRIRQQLDLAKAILAEMQNRCVEVFDPKSELPAAYPWMAPLRGVTESGRCVDGMRFPHGFMKLMAAAPCSKDGSFRLALAPGRYAVSIGITPFAPSNGLGPSSWWQYVDVPPRRWLQLVSPKRDYGATCTSDTDCMGPAQCLEISSGQGSKGTVHECLSRSPSQPPAYDSGMRGRIGAPRVQCYTEAPPPPSQEDQCIEAFREGSIEMTACAVCRFDDGEFVLPLAPGRYTLEIGQESRTVEVLPGQWSELYLEGAKPGTVQFPSCPNVP